MQEISETIQKVVQKLFSEEAEIELTSTEEQFGDYATNVALRLSKKVGQNPREVAQQIVDNLKHDSIEKLEIAGPGFINLTLSNKALIRLAYAVPAKPLENQIVVAEYSDPNPFKVLHAGHLYTSVTGDAIANLLENAGAVVHRVNFGGDVGLHVAKALWGITKVLGGELPEKLNEVVPEARSDWMASAYQNGNTAYEEDEKAKAEITAINKQVYDFYTEDDKSSPLAQIYWTCRTWSYDYFDAFYARIGTKFEKYYPESQTAPLGLATVKEHVGDVYEESNGAIVFNGEKHGLHTRVFINSNGLPTYEAKDVGLAMKKWEDYSFDKSVIITGNDIVEYMKVVMKSIEGFLPEATRRTSHLTHGQVKLAGGVKMSSRKGNFLRAVDVLEVAAQANKAANDQEDEQVSLGAVKYAFLKQRMGGDIVYDPKESVSLQGNSGPYLQYAHARACSVLAKSAANKTDDGIAQELEVAERSLLRKISEYNEVVERATTELMPHHVCTYLYELAQGFNRFYEHNRVIDDPREAIRIQLVSSYAQTLKHGLTLLGIHASEKM
jgi:arginyl-tRNA synthetase